MSFAQGFFGTLARGMEDKRDFIRNRIEEDRQYLRQQGLQRMAQVQETRAGYEAAARELINRGADEQAVLAHLQSNPQGVMSMFREVTNRGIVNKDVINSIFNISDNYAGTLTLEDVIAQIAPLAADIPQDANPAEVERRTIAGWLGLDTEEALNREVYSRQIVGGMTGDQILAAIGTPVTPRGSGQNVGTLNYQALEDAKPMTETEIRENHFFLDNDYMEYGASRISELTTIIEEFRTQGGELTPEKQAELQSLMDEKELLEGIMGLPRDQRLPELIKRFGLIPNARRMWEQSPEVFEAFPEFGELEPILRAATGGVEDLEETSEEVVVPDPVGTPDPVEAPTGDAETDRIRVFMSEEDAAKGAQEAFEEDNSLDSIRVSVDGNVYTINRTSYNPRADLSDIVERIDEDIEEPGEIQTSVDTPSSPSYWPYSSPGTFAEDYKPEVDRGVSRAGLFTRNTSRANQPTPDFDPYSRPPAEGMRRLYSEGEEYLRAPNEDISSDWVTEVFEELGIRPDTPFGNNMANALLRDDMEEKRQAVRYILDELEKRGFKG